VVRIAEQKLERLALALPASALAALALVGVYRTSPMVLLLGMAGAAAAAVSLVRPMWGIYLAIGLLPLERFALHIGGAVFSPAKATFVMAAVAWVVRELARGKLPIDMKSPLAKPYALLLLAVVPGLFFAHEPEAALKTLGLWTALFVVYQMIVSDGRVDTVRNVLIVLAVAGAVTGIMAIVSSHAGTHERLIGSGEYALGRAAGEFLSPNGLAAMLAMTLPAALALALRGPPSFRPVALASFVAGFIGLLLSLSRGGIFAAAGALALMLVWRPWRRVAALAVAAMIAVALTVGNPLGSVQQVDTISHRISTVTFGFKKDPRPKVWRESVSIIGRHPLFGVGAANLHIHEQFTNAAQLTRSPTGVQYYRFPDHAHNIVLTITSELGLLGLAGLIWLFVALVRVLVRATRRALGPQQALGFAVAAALASVFVQGLVDYVLTSGALAGIVVVLTACAVVLASSDPVRIPAEGRRRPVPATPPRIALPGWVPGLAPRPAGAAKAEASPPSAAAAPTATSDPVNGSPADRKAATGSRRGRIASIPPPPWAR
jgi:O-antigen ligase